MVRTLWSSALVLRARYACLAFCFISGRMCIELDVLISRVVMEVCEFVTLLETNSIFSRISSVRRDDANQER